MVNLFDSNQAPLIECLCIDHDLGTVINKDGDYRGENGYDIIKWAIEHNVLPKHVQIVSQNPGAKRISHQYFCKLDIQRLTKSILSWTNIEQLKMW